MELKRLYNEATMNMTNNSITAYNYKVIVDNVLWTKMFYDKVDIFCKEKAMIKVDCLIPPLNDEKIYRISF